jgi:hypothetical protein
MRILIARVAKLGAEIRAGTRCEALVTDDRDGVVGVVSSAKRAEERVLARRGVVLATGGFIFNPAMLALHAPQLVGCSPIGAPTDDGSGIRMGIGLGAAAIQMGPRLGENELVATANSIEKLEAELGLAGSCTPSGSTTNTRGMAGPPSSGSSPRSSAPSTSRRSGRIGTRSASPSTRPLPWAACGPGPPARSDDRTGP